MILKLVEKWGEQKILVSDRLAYHFIYILLETMLIFSIDEASLLTVK